MSSLFLSSCSRLANNAHLTALLGESLVAFILFRIFTLRLASWQTVAGVVVILKTSYTHTYKSL